MGRYSLIFLRPSTGPFSPGKQPLFLAFDSDEEHEGHEENQIWNEPVCSVFLRDLREPSWWRVFLRNKRSGCVNVAQPPAGTPSWACLPAVKTASKTGVFDRMNRMQSFGGRRRPASAYLIAAFCFHPFSPFPCKFSKNRRQSAVTDSIIAPFAGNASAKYARGFALLGNMFAGAVVSLGNPAGLGTSDKNNLNIAWYSAAGSASRKRLNLSVAGWISSRTQRWAFCSPVS